MAILIQALLFSLSGMAMSNPIMRSEARSSDVGMHDVGMHINSAGETVAPPAAANGAAAPGKKKEDSSRATQSTAATEAAPSQVPTEVSGAICGGDFTFVECGSPYLARLIETGLTRKQYIHSAEDCRAIAEEDLSAAEGNNFKLLTEKELLKEATNWDQEIRAENIAIFSILRGGSESVEGIPTRCFRMPCNRAGDLLKKLKTTEESMASDNNKKCYFFNEVESEMTEKKQTDNTGHSMCAIPRYIFSEEHKLGTAAACPPGYESLARDDEAAQEMACLAATSVCEGSATVKHCERQSAFISGLGKGCFVAKHGLQKHRFVGEANEACIFSSTSKENLSLEKQIGEQYRPLESSQMVFTQLCKKTHSK
jgi:hypothetical protein